MKISMKRFYLLALAAALAFAGCGKDKDEKIPPPTEDENFASLFDPAFLQILEDRGYITDAENITPQDVAAITELDVSGSSDSYGSLTSLQGIEYFESLETLNCSFNELTVLDVSQNTKLTHLNCYFNMLTELDVSGCTVLAYLNCSCNELTELDTSSNTKLMYFDCSYNQLKSIIISGCSGDGYLDFSDNEIESLVVGDCPE